MKEGRVENFVIFPRQILSDLRNGLLTPNEFMTFCYIRLSGNPYGIAIVSLENIVNDIFRGMVGVNYCNKLVLSLKSKNYIQFKSRQGRRGSFEVELGDWKLPNGNIKNIGRSLGATMNSPLSEASQSFDTRSQKLLEQKTSLLKPLRNQPSESVRSTYNDNNKDKDINVSRISFKGLVETTKFEPDSADQYRCKEIAQFVGDHHINPTLKLLSEFGPNLLEEAFGLLKEDLRSGKRIENKGAYLRGVAETISFKRKESLQTDSKN